MPEHDRKAEVDSTSLNGSERSLWYGVVGAGVGGVVGYFVFFASLRYASLYTLVIPGALIGLGRAVGTKTASIPLGVACGVSALVLLLWIEWQITVHAEDETIPDFLLHLHEKPWRDVASLIAGPLLATWFGLGRRAREGDGLEESKLK